MLGGAKGESYDFFCIVTLSGAQIWEQPWQMPEIYCNQRV